MESSIWLVDSLLNAVGRVVVGVLLVALGRTSQKKYVTYSSNIWFQSNFGAPFHNDNFWAIFNVCFISQRWWFMVYMVIFVISFSLFVTPFVNYIQTSIHTFVYIFTYDCTHVAGQRIMRRMKLNEKKGTIISTYVHFFLICNRNFFLSTSKSEVISLKCAEWLKRFSINDYKELDIEYNYEWALLFTKYSWPRAKLITRIE